MTHRAFDGHDSGTGGLPAIQGWSCDSVESWILVQESPVDRAALPAGVAVHLAGCSDCSQEWQDRQALPGALLSVSREEGEPSLDPSLTRSVLAEVRRMPAPIRRSERRIAAWRSVAAIFLAVGLTFAGLSATVGFKGRSVDPDSAADPRVVESVLPETRAVSSEWGVVLPRVDRVVFLPASPGSVSDGLPDGLPDGGRSRNSHPQGSSAGKEIRL